MECPVCKGIGHIEVDSYYGVVMCGNCGGTGEVKEGKLNKVTEYLSSVLSGFPDDDKVCADVEKEVRNLIAEELDKLLIIPTEYAAERASNDAIQEAQDFIRRVK